MYSELECGICYQTYNAGQRCPRELQCKHSFCESCLLALTRPRGTDATCLGADIVCPMCRHVTSIAGKERIRAALRVDECVLERMMAEGVLEQEGDLTEEVEDSQVEVKDEGVEEEEEDPSSRSRRQRLRQSLGRIWGKINGRQRRGPHCMTDAELRTIAMMSSYMF